MTEFADHKNGMLIEIGAEYARACGLFAPFNSTHEGYAVLMEEVEELWEQIKLRKHNRDYAKMRKEAIQIGAMALKMMDCIDAEVKTQI